MTVHRVLPALAAAVVLMAGCKPPGSGAPPSSPGGSAVSDLPPCATPDLPGLSDVVRDQLGDEQRYVSQRIASQTTSAVEQAEAYGRLGALLLEATFSDAAETCYLYAQALAPGEVRWPYSLGHVYLAKGDRHKAAASFERALAMRPSDMAALVWLGETYLDQGRPDAAEPMFRKALTVSPGSAAALAGAGRAALARRAYSDAVQYFERALAADPQSSSVHYPLAMAYRALGDRTNAEAHVRRRGNRSPSMPDPLRPATGALLKSPAVHEAEGIRALGNGDWASAAAAFRRGLELRPDDTALRHRLGSALYAAGDVAGAVKEFDEVTRRSPKFVKAHVSLGVILNLNGRYQEAIGRFRTAIAADPAFPEGHLGLGEALCMSGQLESSLPSYQRAIALDPGLAEAWIGGAQALVGLGRRQAALEWLADARQVHPGRPELDELWARVQPSAKD